MAGEQSQLWGALVKAMTRKIEVPGIAQGQKQDDIVAAFAAERREPVREDESPYAPGGRRATDPLVDRVGDPSRISRAAMPSVSAGLASTPTSPDVALRRLVAHLEHVPRGVVQDYLDRHGGPRGPLAARLQALGLAPDESTGQDFWWDAIRGGMPAEIIAEVLRSAPGMPEYHEGSGSLFDYLLEAEAVTYRAAKEAAATGLREARRLLDVLIEGGALGEDRAAKLAASFLGVEVRTEAWEPDLTMSATVTPDLAEAFDIVPMTDGGGRGPLTLLSPGDPGPIVQETLGRLTGRDVRLLIESPARFAELRATWIEDSAASRKAASKRRGKPRSSGRGRSRKEPRASSFRFDHDAFAGFTSPPEAVRLMMEQATGIGATDIHLEPQAETMRVRYRLDGILHDVTRMRSQLGDEVLSRIKVMADMDITERRRPQDGHIHLDLDGEPFDFRIATVPTSQGEKMAIRITAGSKEVPTLQLLGLDEGEEHQLRDFTHRSHGIVLACGPVGSGKTTTLYASIGEIDAVQKNIMTIEDPVEIELPDVAQVPVNYKIGIDFSRGLRALLRQDPNIILVGEVRDEETAKVAIRGSLTGLLVYSTIHANSAPGAVTTLYNFNIPPFLLASSLVGVVAQRLIRTICPHCRERYEPDPALVAQAGLPESGSIWPPPPEPTAEELADAAVAEAAEAAEAAAADEEGKKKKRKTRKKTKKEEPQGEPVEYWHGAGCDQCYATGYLGRTGIFEILTATQAMRLAISERAPESQIRDMAIEGGMRSLDDSGRRKVLAGVSTVEEFIRVLYQ